MSDEQRQRREKAAAQYATPGRDVPVLYKCIQMRATKSRAAAVKLFCLECVGYVRKDVRDCTAPLCPLYAWRPYQRGIDETDEALAELEDATTP